MKKAIVALALIMSMGFNQVSLASSAPKHRYTPSTEQVDKSANASQKHKKQMDEEAMQDEEAEDEQLDVYSDTASVDSAYEDDYAEDDNQGNYSHSRYSLLNYDDPFDYIGSVFGKGALWCVGIFTVIFTLLFVFAPLLIILLILRYLYRRHNDRMRLAEMAMDKGVNIPESSRPIDRQSSDYLMKRGIRNACLGFGLAIMFGIWGSRLLSGFSALVLCYGIGQILISLLPIIRNFFRKDSFGQNGYNQDQDPYRQNQGPYRQNQGSYDQNSNSYNQNQSSYQNPNFAQNQDSVCNNPSDFVKNDDAQASDKQE